MNLPKLTQPGTLFWAVKREYDTGKAYCLQSCMFLAEIQGLVIILPYVGFQSDVNVKLTLTVEMEESRKDFDRTRIEIFPIEDCFLRYKDACEALNKELESK